MEDISKGCHDGNKTLILQERNGFCGVFCRTEPPKQMTLNYIKNGFFNGHIFISLTHCPPVAE